MRNDGGGYFISHNLILLDVVLLPGGEHLSVQPVLEVYRQDPLLQPDKAVL